MPTFTRTSEIDAPADALFDLHARPGALARLTPPWEDVEIVEQEPPTRVGARAVVRTTSLGPLRTTIVSRIVATSRPDGFVDEMEQGPFSSWRHDHRFRATGPGRALLEDVIDWRAPGGPLARAFVEPRLARMFAWRHDVVKNDLALARDCPAPPRLTVGVTGAGGSIGREVVALFRVLGADVRRFVRGARTRDDEVAWDVETGRVDGADGLDAVVHLAGENIGAGRLDAAKQARVRASRGDATARLVAALRALPSPPRVFVSASGVGAYGDRGDELLDESSPLGAGFLADVCRAWEAAAATAEPVMRWVSLRFGVVLTPRDGALARMLPVFRAGVGGRLGDGRQRFPVLSVDDAAGVVWRAVVDGRARGPILAALPDPPTNAAFTRALADVLGRPAVLPVPAFAVRVALGPLADLGVLASTRTEPRKLAALGHRWRHPTPTHALRHVLGIS